MGSVGLPQSLVDPAREADPELQFQKKVYVVVPSLDPEIIVVRAGRPEGEEVAMKRAFKVGEPACPEPVEGVEGLPPPEVPPGGAEKTELPPCPAGGGEPPPPPLEDPEPVEGLPPPPDEGEGVGAGGVVAGCVIVTVVLDSAGRADPLSIMTLGV